MKFIQNNTGFLLICAFLILHLFIINDYGLTWDFHHHFFAGMHLLGIPTSIDTAANTLPYTVPDPRGTYNLPFGPIMSILPVISWIALYKQLSLLSFDNAYNIISIFWGVAGIGFLYYFLKESVSARVALLAALLLGLTPRYFGDLHNNMKDIPQTAVFILNMWILWRLSAYKKPRDLIFSILAFVLAFNIKVNSIFIPIIFGVWLVTNNIKKISKIEWLYFLIAPILAFLFWSLFWKDPIGQLLYIPQFFRDNTINIEVLLSGKWYCSGINVPWYYPLWYLAITTPLPILLFFLIGLIRLIRHIRPIGMLLLLWFFLPLARYIFPQMGVIDGVRHFEEVLPALAAIAAIGLDQIRPIRLMRLICLICLIFLLFINYASHPYQITYFNELVGGAKGAFGNYDLDYWGTSQKAAVKWINAHAPRNAKIYIMMAADVAGRYLRPDLLPNLNKHSYEDSDYLVLLNRQSFLYRFFYAYDFLLTHKPTHAISIQGIPLTWIFDNRTANKTPRQTPWWKGIDPCIIPYWKEK